MRPDLPPRISVKALIIDAGRILLPMHRDEDGVYFILPGGGQERGETVVAALERECRDSREIATLRYLYRVEPELARGVHVA